MVEALSSRVLLSANVSGEWQGTRSAVAGYSDSQTVTLSLTLNGTNVSGTEHIAESSQPQYYADYSLEGTVSGNTFEFRDVSIMEYKDPPGYTWGLPSYSLQVATNGNSISGPWKNSEGNSGEISLTKVPSPKVVLTEATTVDAKSVTVDYAISAGTVDGPLLFDVYRSDEDVLDSSSKLIGSETLDPSEDSADLMEGNHSVKLIPGTTLTPDTKMEYVIVVADKNDGVAEAPGSTNTAYFQKFMLGAISHGQADPTSLSNATPAWETTMATGLMNPKYCDFNDVIAFNWMAASRLPESGEATTAGKNLAEMVLTKANELTSAHSGDVVDLYFIGHSRGAVVVSQAIEDLQGTKDPSLEGSYITEALLDPHPANLSTLGLYSGSSSSEIAIYQAFEDHANDPAVVIPSNVKLAEIYYQHTPYTYFGITDPEEHDINLWGEGPNEGIVDESSASVVWHNLTDTFDNSPFSGTAAKDIGWIGHAEVPLWYIVHVVDAGLDV